MSGKLGYLIKEWPTFWQAVIEIMVLISLPIILISWLLFLDFINYSGHSFIFLLYPIFIFWFLSIWIYYVLIRNYLEKVGKIPASHYKREPILEFTGTSIRNRVTTQYTDAGPGYEVITSRRKKRKTLPPKTIHVKDIPPNAIDLWTHELLVPIAKKGNPIIRCPGCGACYEKSSWDYFGGCAKPECEKFAKR